MKKVTRCCFYHFHIYISQRCTKAVVPKPGRRSIGTGPRNYEMHTGGNDLNTSQSLVSFSGNANMQQDS